MLDYAASYVKGYCCVQLFLTGTADPCDTSRSQDVNDHQMALARLHCAGGDLCVPSQVRHNRDDERVRVIVGQLPSGQSARRAPW